VSKKRRPRSGNPAKQTPPAKQAAGGKPAIPGDAELISLDPPAGLAYPQVLRTPEFAWWRSILGILVALSLYFLVVSVVSQLLVLISYAITRPSASYADYYGSAQAFEVPAGMMATNLGIACLIPISFVVVMIVHHVRPRWLGSVQPRLRWRWLAISLGIAAVALAAVFALSTFFGPAASINPQPQFWIFMIIIVLTSPLQAAGEEYLFRGYLLQSLGSMVRTPWFGVIASSLIFALFHGTQNLPLFIDRLAFGLLAAMLVWKTGGLEAAIGAHVINNVYAFGIAGLTGTIAQARAVQQIGWVDAVFDVGGFALFAVLAWLVGRRLKLRTTT
jgi:membrane protease YdiL (CAAX protease family)